jgi:succinyl-CoA synthetase alpha subunit
VQDMLRVSGYISSKDATLIGPNCPGVISPDKSNVSIMPRDIFQRGNVGVVSRSGTLTYQVVNELTQRDIGQSTSVGIGGDPIIGTNFVEILEKFEADLQTECVVMIGEIGGNAEQLAAEYIQSEMKTPVVAYIAGFTAPEGKTMGHAGAIVSGGDSTAQAKSEALRRSGIRAAENPSEVAELVADALGVSSAT